MLENTIKVSTGCKFTPEGKHEKQLLCQSYLHDSQFSNSVFFLDTAAHGSRFLSMN